MKALHTPRTWAAMLLAVVLLTPLAVSLQGCTDLDEETFGVITPDQFFRTEAEIVAALAPVYAQLRAMMWNYHNISEVTSDEAIIPTRGTDWDDGGHWRQLHQHNWDALTVDWNGAWVDAYTGIARANVVLENLAAADVSQETKDAVSAELRFLRAFYYYQLMDLFGGVPIVEAAAVDPDNPPSRNTRAEVFQFVESELNAIRDALPETWDTANLGRATRGAADALLAKIYLNAREFTGEVTTDGIQRGQARWQDAIDAADRVINSGVYSLAGDYFDNFRVDNHTSPEIIFMVGHLARPGLGLTFIMRTLHYNQIPETPWNGFSTLAERFNSFDDDDRRKLMFLVGLQRSGPNEGCVGQECFSSGDPLTDRVGNPLEFTPDFRRPDGTPVTGTPINVNETSGVRVLKWEIDPSRVGGDNGNNYAFFRLAEMYLIKAEALIRQGDVQGGMALINLIRERVFEPDEPLTASNQAEALQHVLDERGRELFWEATRRQDLIRFDQFTRAWEFKPESQPYRVLGPIPQVQIDANPNLTQNPGY
ncbi:RagB/SusD family nutrient uptake outer membrane protein [Rhodocaloribacter litoris]|uniref:RagB/SusD family nutrient uptake outer membrane protein n=1 Tax=Rhodocaloribacter litoris TaxID=2558931 RepID=UPI0014249388|nr:RagB/SusD family nutrient uptake outer membrane protein [Rhodocaloribacter litoris]QXD16587.1 RagB/SusD family nutrient uptake outer membrane protein [Rhodocaloribacter litoris]